MSLFPVANKWCQRQCRRDDGEYQRNESGMIHRLLIIFLIRFFWQPEKTKDFPGINNPCQGALDSRSWCEIDRQSGIRIDLSEFMNDMWICE